MERSFKGIWIPKEIWLSKELSLQEKVFLVEIDSLDNEDGCFASNAYFGDFFGLSNGRVSQVIKSLNEKGYITVTLEREGKQIIRRIIKINRPPYPIYNFKGYLENERGYLENGDTPIKFSKEGYLENDKDNNTSINNININKINNHQIEEEFEELWFLYPKKQGKKKALDKYIKCRKKNIVTFEKCKEGILNYNRYIEQKKVQSKYIKQGSTWFNQECWNDQYDIEPQRQLIQRNFEEEFGEIVDDIDF